MQMPKSTLDQVQGFRFQLYRIVVKEVDLEEQSMKWKQPC